MSIGGTTVRQEQKFPLGIVMLAIVLVAIDVYWTVRDDRPPQAPRAVDVQPATQPVIAAPTPAPNTPTTPAADVTPKPATPTAQSPDVVASLLERDLKDQELWSTVAVVGNHVDIRSSSCNTPGMTKTLGGAIAAFKAAGVIRVRCREPSGTLVFDRGL